MHPPPVLLDVEEIVTSLGCDRFGDWVRCSNEVSIPTDMDHTGALGQNSVTRECTVYGPKHLKSLVTLLVQVGWGYISVFFTAEVAKPARRTWLVL